MCGISGFVSKAGSAGRGELEAIANRMSSTLRHRGPDDMGVWADSESGVALGFRRLSIIDLSAEGHQPMHSTGGRYVIVYNGEIYNFQALREQLEPLGHRFRGHSDTEVLLAAIDQWGVEEALPRLNGMFAFALWDRKQRVLHLARDRLGEKPLYYGWMDGVFLFGSELKALQAHPKFVPDIDRDALALYLRYKYVPTPHSIFRNIHKLPPAARLSFPLPATQNQVPAAIPYWSARCAAEQGAAEPFTASESEIIERSDGLLREAVRLRMVADVPLGGFLSGGVDSSMIVALMQAQSGRPVQTFTVGFHEAGYNEAEDAQRVARHLGTDHTELYVTPQETMDVIPRLPQLYDEPFSDSSQIPTFLISELARRHVTVSLSGDGGDELFGGYNRYFWGSRLWPHIAGRPKALRSLMAGAMTALPPGAWDFLFGMLGPLLPAGLRQTNPGDKMHKLAGILSADTQQVLYQGLVSQWRDCASLVRGANAAPDIITEPESWPEMPDFRQQMMYLDTITYLPDDILVKVDRASMGVGLEARAPYLDHNLVEFACRIPLPLKFRDGVGKWLLRQVLYKYVPRELIERPKQGFGVPIHAWLRGPLRAWAESHLDEQRLRKEGFLDPAPIRRKWREHLSGVRNWQYELWSVLMFQAWLEARQRTRP